MTPSDGPAGKGALPGLRSALADRTTRPADAPPPPHPFDAPLRAVIARVLRTGRGPAAVVRWVGRETAHTPPPPDADAVAELADRLRRRLLPAPSGATQAD